jgi:hypothetical protein
VPDNRDEFSTDAGKLRTEGLDAASLAGIVRAVPGRTPGKLGRQPAKRVALRFIHEYAREPLPAPAYPVDVTGGIADNSWGMLGNGADPSCTTHPDGVGDCGYSARQHARMSKAACYGETETWETSDQLVAEYLLYDGGQDNGVVLADVLLAWYKAGRIKAFAPVDRTDPVAVDSAMQAFKGVIAGVDLPGNAQQQFGSGQPWTLGGQQPDPSLGHAIVKVTADGHGADGWVTWGCRQDSDTAWTAACVQECWVIITGEDEAAKVEMAALLADIEALGGTGGRPAPAPAPPPVPAPPAPVPPSPQPGLLAELAALIREVEASAERGIEEITGWLSRHGL